MTEEQAIAYEYLVKVRRSNEVLQKAENFVKDLAERCNYIGGGFSGERVMGGKRGVREDFLARYLDEKANVEEKRIDVSGEGLALAFEIYDKCPKLQQAQVLVKYFCDALTMRQVAAEMKISVSCVHVTYNDALTTFYHATDWSSAEVAATVESMKKAAELKEAKRSEKESIARVNRADAEARLQARKAAAQAAKEERIKVTREKIANGGRWWAKNDR